MAATTQAVVSNGIGPWPQRWARPRAADILHGDKRLAKELAHLVNGGDVGVLHGGRGPGFVVPGDCRHLLRGQTAAQNHLQGDDPSKVLLPGLKNDTHAAAAKLFQQLELAEIADGGLTSPTGRPSAKPCVRSESVSSGGAQAASRASRCSRAPASSGWAAMNSCLFGCCPAWILAR